ncbi:MAG: hypothetical protein P1P87_00760 [Trueperaceae bacterium]|nr:hypothetical protein [Trueperaceae bacterium]
MRTVRLDWAALATVALLLGCAQVDSVGVATAEIHPQLRVVSSAFATEVSVVLFRGAGGFTRL